MSLLSVMRGGTRDVGMPITSLEDYALAVNEAALAYGYGGGSGGLYPEGITQTMPGVKVEQIDANFSGLAQSAYKANGIVFACMLVRLMVFSTARFRFQRLRNGQPADTFGTPALGVFERPWVGGTTQDLLGRMIQDADLAGNAFLTVQGGEVVRLRPDWVDIVVEPRMLTRGGMTGQLGWVKRGYLYYEGGRQRTLDPVPLLLDEVAHWMPHPDPEAPFRGMSWLTPIIREIQADGLMNTHKRMFFENGATPNVVIKHDVNANEEKVRRFQAALDEKTRGVHNAYRTLNLYPGADLTVVGSDLRQIDFKQVQGGGETRIAAAAGVPPVIAGFSEGLQAATYSNYAQARRRLADGTIHPLWQNAAGSLEPLIPLRDRPPGVDWRLWYDVSDVPFLREDAADAANITSTRAQTIRAYLDGGFTPESAIAAVKAGDESLLVHTGLVSVQLQEPGAAPPGQDGGSPSAASTGNTNPTGSATP